MENVTTMADAKEFPLIVMAEDRTIDPAHWCTQYKSELRQLLDHHGCIVLRNFPLEDVEGFETAAQALTSARWVDYLEATSPRDHVRSNTSTSTKYQSDKTIFFHNEKSYSYEWPYNLFFYCEVAPNSNGETPLADCRRIYKDIPHEVLEKFRRKKLMYVRRFSNNMGIPWKKAFSVESQRELEEYCRRNRIEQLSWQADGTPVLKYVRDTVVVHPRTGEKCWFNHGTFFNVNSLEPELKTFFLSNFGQEGLPYNTYYGDGEEIEPEVIQLLRGLYERHSNQIPWQKGDMLYIDNILVAHGRRPFTGPRRILVTMSEAMNCDQVESF